MKTLIRSALLALAMVILSGCVSNPPVQTVITDEEVGPYPTEYKFIAESYLNQLLKDPDSAKFRYAGEPFKGYDRIGYGWKQTFQFHGWVVPVSVNAKNSYGGYTGWTRHYVIIKHDTVIRKIDHRVGLTEEYLQP